MAFGNQANIKAVITAEDRATRVLQGFGAATQSVGRKVATAMKVASVAVSGIAAILGKMVIGGGISRALNIEDAQAKLKGLGHSVKTIENIMDSALKSVKGTAFGLDAAATAAASAVAAGIKPGKELTRVLALTGDTATITGRQFNEAGAIINKILASNRVSMEEVNQLQDAGLPIMQMLAKQYKVNTAELREMVSNGEVDSKIFLKAIEKNIGGAALASGNTTRGAWENMKAAMARVGAAIVKDIIPRVRDAFGDLTKWFDDNSDNIVKSVTNAMIKIEEFTRVVVNLAKRVLPDIIRIGKQWAQNIEDVGRPIAMFLLPKLEALFNTIRDDLVPALVNLWKNVLQPLVPVLGVLLVAALAGVIDGLNILVTSVSWVIKALSDGNPIVWAFVAALAAVKVALMLQGALAAYTVVMNGVAAKFVATRLLLLSPIALPALAIGAVIGSLIAVQMKAKETKRVVKEALNNVKNASESTTNAVAKLQKLALNGTPEQQARAKSALRGLATGGSFATGGFTGTGGANEVAGIVHKGEYVVPKNQVDQSTGQPKMGGSQTINLNVNVGMYAGTEIEKRKMAKTLLKAMQDMAASQGISVNQMMGSR